MFTSNQTDDDEADDDDDDDDGTKNNMSPPGRGGDMIEAYILVPNYTMGCQFMQIKIILSKIILNYNAVTVSGKLLKF